MFGASSVGGRLEPDLFEFAIHVVRMNNLILVKHRNTAEASLRYQPLDYEPVHQRESPNADAG